MLEQIDLDRKMKRREWRAARLGLGKRLSNLQVATYLSKTPVLVLCEGLPGDGRDAAIDALTAGLDPRGYRVEENGLEPEVAQAYPRLRRYWLNLPHAGEIVIFHNSWYAAALADLMCGRIIEDDWRRVLRDIRDTERMLVDDGYVLIKLWFALNRKAFTRRLATTAPDDGLTADSPPGAATWCDSDHYEECMRVADEMLVRTAGSETPWTIVEGNNQYYAWWRTLTSVANALEDALTARGATLDRLLADRHQPAQLEPTQVPEIPNPTLAAAAEPGTIASQQEDASDLSPAGETGIEDLPLESPSTAHTKEASGMPAAAPVPQPDSETDEQEK